MMEHRLFVGLEVRKKKRVAVVVAEGPARAEARFCCKILSTPEAMRMLCPRFCQLPRQDVFFWPAVRETVFSHEAIRAWEAKLTTALAEDLRRCRRGHIRRSWYVDETYIKVHSGWRHPYRAFDRDEVLVDLVLSEHRDLAAAKAFFRSARTITGVVLDRVTSNGHDAYPAAIRSELGEAVRHRTNAYVNNRVEQDHRGIKDRYRPMPGFKSVTSAGRFCRAFDEVRGILRVRSLHRQHVSADRRRLRQLRHTVTVLAILEAA